ncbi:MAG: PAS domain S-box protein [Methanomicrobiaceae archaeon]|nr:PAS domain S-box protein [Methanomicrobiaceae archaeon]
MFSVIYTDDESSLLEVGKIFLERSGLLKVETALSAKEAIELLKTKEIDCVVSDYMMPEMDGIAFLKHLRAENNQIPFILFTGRGREEIAIEALNAGADYYLQKGGDPVSQFTELEHKIRLAAGRKRTEEELRKSEEKYRILTERTNDIFYSTDAKGRITHIGPQVARYGFEPEEIISKKFEELIIEEDLETTVEDFIKTVTTGEPTITVFRIHDKSGNIFWMEDNGGAVINEKGEITGISGILRDVTDRKKIEQKLLDSERRYRDLIEMLPQCVFETDEKGIIISANHAAFEAFGYTPADLERGLNAIDMLVPEDRERGIEKINNILQGDNTAGTEYMAVRKDGTIFPVMIFANAIIRKNRAVGVRGVIFDATELKKAEEACRISEERYKRLFENACDMIIIFEPDGTITELNSTFERDTGHSRTAILGKYVNNSGIMTEDSAALLISNISKIISGEKPPAFGIKAVRKDGSTAGCEVRLSRLTKNGKVTAVQAILREQNGG